MAFLTLSWRVSHLRESAMERTTQTVDGLTTVLNASSRDEDRGVVSNGDMTVNRVWRERGKDTGIVDKVSGGTVVEDILRWRRMQRQVVEVLSERRGVPRLR
jgi:hypothetical protein